MSKKSYRQLQRDNEMLRTALSKEIKAFRDSADLVLNEVGDQMAHLILGQEILADAIRKAAYKERTSGETKLWFDGTWSKRHELLKQLQVEYGEEEGLNQMLTVLGVESLQSRFIEINDYVKKTIGDRAIQLYMLEMQFIDEQEDVA